MNDKTLENKIQFTNTGPKLSRKRMVVMQNRRIYTQYSI